MNCRLTRLGNIGTMVVLVAVVALGNFGCGGGSATTQQQTQLPPPQTFTITTTSLPNGITNAPYNATLQSSGGTPPITWSLQASSLPSNLSLSSGGTISGTPVAPGSSCLVFQGTDSSTPQESAAQQLCIAITSTDVSHNALLKGPYAFVIKGYPSANLYGLRQGVTAGNFVADGNGNITSGVSGPSDKITGTYALGSDNRGTISISDPTAGTVTTYAFSAGSMSASGVATKGRMIQFDAQASPFVGEFELQDTTAFSNSAINGSYAFVMSGWGLTEPFGADGVLTTDGLGNFTGGTADENVKGAVSADLPLTGTYNIAANSTDGRVTGTLTIGGTTFDFTFFVVSANKLLMTGFTPGSNPAFIGQALKQSVGPFNNGSLNGTSIFSTMGMGRIQNVKAGLYNFDGGGMTTVLEDENSAGSVTLASTSSASYKVESNGRVSVVTGGSIVSVLYLVSSNQGFILDTDTNTKTGFFEPQAFAPFTGSSIDGNFFFGDLPSSCCRSVSSGVATLEAGTISETSDIDQPGLGSNTLFYGQTSSDAYSVLSNGRVTTGSGKQVIYIVSPTKFLIIDVDPTNTTPDIAVAEQ